MTRIPHVSRGSRKGLILLAVLAAVGCVSAYEAGDRLYRQGDVASALHVWGSVSPGDSEYERVAPRLKLVQDEWERQLKRYEKRARFYESQGRLAEAVLYYRLTLKLDPRRTRLLGLVQELVRTLERRVDEERHGLELAVPEGRLQDAALHARRLERLDPFDPATQIEIRQVRAAVGSEVLRNLEDGKQAFSRGDRRSARRSFERVLELDESQEAAHGYLAYIRRFKEIEADERVPPSPRTIPPEDILAEGHFQSGQRAERRGEPFAAIAEYQAVLDMDSEHEAARHRVAVLRKQLEPQIDELYATGNRHFQDEDLDNALRYWRRVLLIDPAHERTRENVDRAQRILSRLEEMKSED